VFHFVNGKRGPDTAGRGDRYSTVRAELDQLLDELAITELAQVRAVSEILVEYTRRGRILDELRGYVGAAAS
jgi:hypothetical protein